MINKTNPRPRKMTGWISVPVPDPAAPADDGDSCPGVVAATPGDHAVCLVVSPASTVRQHQRPRALRHHRLLLQAVQGVQVHQVGLGRRGQGQHQDNSGPPAGMSPHRLPPPGLPGAQSEILLPVLHVEDGDVEQEFGVFGSLAQEGAVIMH